MKVKFGLLVGTGIGYLIGSGKARELLRQGQVQLRERRTGVAGAARSGTVAPAVSSEPLPYGVRGTEGVSFEGTMTATNS